MPISHGARSITWSASPFRPCSGASYLAPARPAACNPSRCGSSAIANSTSKNSSPRNIGRSPPNWPPRAMKYSKHASSAPTGRRSSASISVRAPRRNPSRAISKTRSSQLHRSKQNRRGAIHHRRSPPRLCSRKQAASSASPQPSPCVWPSDFTKAWRSTAKPPA